MELMSNFLLAIILSNVRSEITDKYSSNQLKPKYSLFGSPELPSFSNDAQEDNCHDKLCSPGHCFIFGKKNVCLCPAGYEYKDGRCLVKKCTSPYRCWPGMCMVVREQEYCLCPQGFFSQEGSCMAAEAKCQRKDCHPGQCARENGEEICLCPEGYYSERGICKYISTSNRKCKTADCKPGRCLVEFKEEKCLCPQGYTAKSGKCIELSATSAGKISTILLMIIVSVASVMFTTFIGVSICYCYYCRQGNYVT